MYPSYFRLSLMCLIVPCKWRTREKCFISERLTICNCVCLCPRAFHARVIFLPFHHRKRFGKSSYLVKEKNLNNKNRSIIDAYYAHGFDVTYRPLYLAFATILVLLWWALLRIGQTAVESEQSSSIWSCWYSTRVCSFDANASAERWIQVWIKTSQLFPLRTPLCIFMQLHCWLRQTPQLSSSTHVKAFIN